VREGWVTATLSDVCLKIQDGAHRSPQKLYSEGGPGRFLYITSKNVRDGYMALDDIAYVDTEFHNSIYPRCNPDLGDILLTKDGANTGNVTLNTIVEPFSLLSSVCLIKTNPSKLIPKFLLYYIQSSAGFEQITGNMTGAAIKRIILQTIKASKIPLPPLPEQERIVAILDEAFAGLATATTNAEKNLKNATELFDNYLNSIFRKQGDEWVDRAVADVANHCLGKMLDRNKNRGEPKPYLRNLNVRWFDFDLSDVLEMRFEKEEVDRYSAVKGDLLICEGGYPGRAAIWERDEPIFFQKAIHRVRFHAHWLTKLVSLFPLHPRRYGRTA